MGGTEKAVGSRGGWRSDGSSKAFSPSNNWRNEIYVLKENAPHFRVQVEKWNDRDEMEPKDKEIWQFMRQNREGLKNTGQIV